MNTASLEDAAKEISRTCQRAKDRDDAEPYTIVVGAGISHPSVPLASTIQKHCEEEAGRVGITEQPQKISAIERYSYWFMKAYPNAIEQQKYLQELIEGKPITAANFRLAHLLLQGSVAQIVLTPNFDEFVSGAISVFGYAGIRLCDHPETVERVDPEEKEIQIVHVHGTYRYYDLANLKPQIELRAEVSRSTSFTMLGLLDRILVNRSPIVVGYSGWDGDVIMTALRRRLGKRLRYRMFWFCHRRDSSESLPDWLKNHEEVVFVVPSGPSRGMLGTRPEIESSSASSSVGANLMSEPNPNERIGEAVLSAQDVFEGLIRELGLEAPELVRDPLGFFARQLRHSIPWEDMAGQELIDPYSLRSVVKRMEHGQRLESESTKDAEKGLEKVRDALRRSLHLEAIRFAGEVRVKDLDDGHSNELVELLSLAVAQAGKDFADQLEACGTALSICESLPIALRTADVTRLSGGALLMKARALNGLERNEEAIDALGEAIKTLSGSGNGQRPVEFYAALELRGVLLRGIGKIDDAIADFDEVVRQAIEFPTTEIVQLAAWALHDKFAILRSLGRADDAILVADELVVRYGNAPELFTQAAVAWTLVNKADLLADEGKKEEALAVREDILQRFHESGHSYLAVPIAWSLYDKACALQDLGRSEQAIVTYDDLIGRFSESSESLAYQIVSALRGKAKILQGLNRADQSVVALDIAITRYGNSKNADIQQFVGSALLEKAQILKSLNRGEEAVVALDEIKRRFAASSHPELSELVKRAEMERPGIEAAGAAGLQP